MTNEPFDDPLTPEEEAAFRALPRTRAPSAALEGRTVGALRARGLLRPRPLSQAGWWAAAAAAAIALFAGGYAVGQARGGANAVEWMVALQEADALERAAFVQRTGSAYVAAVASLDASGNGVEPGEEAAISALRAALNELARLRPDDARVLRARDALVEQPVTDSVDAPVQRVVWF